MTYSRTLVVLAKSIKNRNFCIAGKDTETHNWVRPVKDCPFSGEELCNLSDRSDPINVLDVVKMTFIEKIPEIFQPENELVDMNVKWSYLGNIQIEDLGTLIDGKQNTFLNQIKNRYIPKSLIESLNLQNSLQLIRITNSNDAKIIYQLAYSQKYYKPKLQFIYKEIQYTLPITDPIISISSRRRKPKILEDAYITIGVGGEFRNSHYIYVVMLREI